MAPISRGFMNLPRFKNYQPYPWRIVQQKGKFQIVTADGNLVASCALEADAYRILACVDVMEGYEDPYAFVLKAKKLKDMVLAVKKFDISTIEYLDRRGNK